jgi:hypothetical protein
MTKEIEFLQAVAYRIHNITLSNALGLLEDAERFLVPPVAFDWQAATLTQRADEARKNATVMAFLPDRKIQAIKEVRTISGLGLKEAKDIVDTIQPPRVTPPVPLWDRSPVEFGGDRFDHHFNDEPPF